MGSVPLKPRVLCVCNRETDGHFETGLVDGFGACWLSKKEPDMVEEAQSSKPDCRHCTGQTPGEWSTLLVGLVARQTA